MKIALTLLGSLCCTLPLFAQMLSNQGASLSVRGSAFVSVKGSVLNDRGGTAYNEGTIYLTGDWTNQANNEVFTSLDRGTVVFQGDDQRINGRSSTRFYDLRLEQTGIKYGDIDVLVNGFLRLNDREFQLDTHAVKVFNPDPNAVQTGLAGNWGFVSSLGNGGLEWRMGQTADYFFPLGSMLGNPRFRPLTLQPQTAQPTQIRSRHANTDATAEGFDRNRREFVVCEVNPLYYHRISRQDTSTNPVFVQWHYEQAADGPFADFGQWSNTALWTHRGQGNSGFDATHNLQTLRSQQPLTDFQPNPFALLVVAPPIDLAANLNPICANDTLALQASGNFPNFDFFIDSLLVQGSSDSLYRQYPSTAGNYRVWVTGFNAFCGRTSDTILLQVLAAPQAQASADTIIVRGTAVNLYASGGDFYQWQPDSALTCALCPQTQGFPTQTTNYIVRVENLDGCLALDTVLVDVREEVANVLFIPNVLTPNGDGKNDTWFIKNIELFPQNKVKILNRLGDVVYQSEYYNNNWEGQYAGGKLPAGTYYYILDLGGNWGIFKGPVTILRE